MSAARMTVASLGLAAALAVACGSEPPPIHSVIFYAEADEGEPLAGVQLHAHGRLIGKTGEQGRLRVRMQGPEGSTVRVRIECPEEHRNTRNWLQVRLRKVRSLGDSARSASIRHTISCPPTKRSAVIVVHTDGRADLPVLVGGREMARTNAEGVAHVALTRAPMSTVTVRLDTEEKPEIRPKNPSQSFRVPDHDEIFVLKQKFEVEEEEEPRRRRRPRPKKPSRPARID